MAKRHSNSVHKTNNVRFADIDEERYYNPDSPPNPMMEYGETAPKRSKNEPHGPASNDQEYFYRLATAVVEALKKGQSVNPLCLDPASYHRFNETVPLVPQQEKTKVRTFPIVPKPARSNDWTNGAYDKVLLGIKNATSSK